MAFVTYILLSTLLAGLRGAFQPELLGYTATTAFAIVVFEILGLKLGTYLLSISNESQLLDLVAYSGYKFVGIIVTIVISEIVNGGKGTGGWAGWTVFGYTFLANAFFLVGNSRFLVRAYLTQFISYGLSNTFFFPRTPRTTVEERCTQLLDRRRTVGRNFSSYTRTLYNLCLCGH
jgi:hypothetical protein